MLFPYQDQFKHWGKLVEIDDITYVYVDDFQEPNMKHKAMLQRIKGMSSEELCNLVDIVWMTLSGQEWDSDTLSTIAAHFDNAGLQISDT